MEAAESPWKWVVRMRSGDRWQTAIVPGAARRHDLAGIVDEVLVSAVARDGREGPAARVASVQQP
jgi:hypothetical protein